MTDTATLTISIPGPVGTYWLTGYRERANGTARFDLSCDLAVKGGSVKPLPILDNADWPTAWTALVDRIRSDRVEATLRSVLPAV